MRGLADLLADPEYGPLIESDLAALYGIDLMHVWRGEVSVRRARVLIERLVDEPTSHLRAHALGGRQHLGWDEQTGLLAHIADAVTFGAHNIQRTLGGKPRRPEPVPRPGVESTEIRVESIDDFPIIQVMAITAG